MSRLKISTQDLESERDNPFHLWTGPSSPPFHHAQSQHNFNDSLPSSPSTPSEFEFGSISSLEIKDDPPVSPKILSSFASTYWGTAAASSFDLRAPISSFNLSAPTPVMKQKIIPISHPIISSTDPPSAPDPSPSVRQLMADEMHGEHDDDFNLDFYSAPQTPMWTPPRKSTTASEQRPSSQDESSLNIVTSHVGQRRRKSNSAVLDRRAHDELVPLSTQKNQMLQSSKSEPNSHFASSFAWEKSEEENNGVIKSKSYVKWAFKDLLRRTVPSSKAEAGYINKAMGASSSKKYLWSTKSNPNMSPLASPMHSSSMSTPRAAVTTHPSTPGRSPTHGPSSPVHSSVPRRPSTPGRTPPRSPLSPHAIHYQQNKAQSLELTRKTFLPYRQSLLGCLGGGPSSFSPDQQVW